MVSNGILRILAWPAREVRGYGVPRTGGPAGATAAIYAARAGLQPVLIAPAMGLEGYFGESCTPRAAAARRRQWRVF